MLVEDDNYLRPALTRLIRLSGFHVDAFSSVEALLAFGIPERGACLVLDVVLPGIGGIEFKRSLAASDRDLPTIFVTALETPDVCAELATLSPVAVLHKPFAGVDLLEAIERAANRIQYTTARSNLP